MRPLRLVLASSSPRRRWLLRQIGLPHRVVVPELDEDAFLAGLAGLSPGEAAERLAAAKAREVAGRLRAPALVVAADTVVVVDGDVLQKPRGPEEAAAMLARLAGRTHEVITGVAVRQVPGGREQVASERTRVTMVPLAPEQIARYVATGEPLDKAGAYAVQGYGSVLVERVEGCYFNVVGLPLALLARMLAGFGVDVSRFWRVRTGAPSRP